jgi:hypothetical protein
MKLMSRLALVGVVMFALVPAALAASYTYALDTTDGVIAGVIWNYSGGLDGCPNQNSANSGACYGYQNSFLTAPTANFATPLVLIYPAISAQMMDPSTTLQSANLSIQNSWWDGPTTMSNIEVSQVNSPWAWVQKVGANYTAGDGENDLWNSRWESDNGVGRYYAQYEETYTVVAGVKTILACSGTDWAGTFHADASTGQGPSWKTAAKGPLIAYCDVVSNGGGNPPITNVDITAWVAGVKAGTIVNRGISVDTLGDFFTTTQADNGNYDFQVTLNYTAQIPGDYDLSGYVDLADYTVWKNHVGSNQTFSGGDGDYSGYVDLADYTVWKNNVGQGTPPEGGVAPEPATMALLAFGALAAIRRKRSA